MKGRALSLFVFGLTAVTGLAQSYYWRINPIRPVFTTAEKAYLSLTFYGVPSGCNVEAFYSPALAGEGAAKNIGNRQPYKSFAAPIKANGPKKYTDEAIYVPTPNGPGYYTVRVSMLGRTQVATFLVSDLGMVAKSASNGVSLWVLNRATGKPVSGANIKLVGTDGGAVLAGGQTNRDGLWTTNRGYSNFEAVAVAGSNVARVRPYNYSRGDDGEAENANSYVYLYTDRPVYRPGDTVHFKGIARNWQRGIFGLPNASTAELVAKDDYNTEVFKGDSSVDGNGVFQGEFTLTRGAGISRYTLTASLGKGIAGSANFDIAEYRKPEYRITITMDPKVVVSGDNLTARLDARYYFGAPLANSKVRWTAFVNNSGWWSFLPNPYDYAPMWGKDDTDQTDSASGYNWGEVKLEGTGTTDKDGMLSIGLPTSFRNVTLDQPAQINISVEMIDIAGREGSANASATILPGNRFAKVDTVGWVGDVGKPTVVEVTAYDPFTQQTVANTNTTVSIVHSRWVEKNGKWNEVRTSKGTRQVPVGSDGQARFEFTPDQAGTYILGTLTADSQGRKSRYESYYWVYGGTDAGMWGGAAALDAIASSKAARIGDTITVLFKASAPNADMLYSIEGGEIHRQGIIRIVNNVARLDVPVSADLMPSFTVWGGYSARGQLQEASVEVAVMDPTKILQVTVTPNADRLMPGQNVSYDVFTKDSNGLPVAAEFSIGVVDEAIYAIRSEKAEDIRDFFYGPEYNRVNTSRSENMYYMAALPGSPAAMARIFQKENKQEGDEKRVRQDFRDTAFWQAIVQTDADGKGQVTFQLPDNLTQWRATVRALGEQTSVGQATNTSLRVSKPLTASLNLPRFLVVGDQFHIIAVARNATDQPITVALSVTSTDQLSMQNRPEASVTVTPGGEQRYDIITTAVDSGAARITMSVNGGGHEDTVIKTLEIERYQNWQIGSVSGTATTTASGTAMIPANINPDSASLQFRLSPSLVAMVLGSVDELATYPYGCIEQTTSPMIADLALLRLVKTRPNPDPKLITRLNDMVQVGLQRIYGMQDYSGGWGWADHSTETDPYWTSYVLTGLLMAKDSGFQISEDIWNRGMTALGRSVANMDVSKPVRSQFKTSEKWKYDQAMWKYRVALHTRVRSLALLAKVDPRTWAQALSGMASKLPDLGNSGIASLAIALKDAGVMGTGTRVFNALMAQGKSGSGLTFWPSDRNGTDYWGWFGEEDTFTTALALRALLRYARPGDARIGQTIKWLASTRRGDSWYSTNDTANIALALVEYVEESGETEFSGQVTVTVNGKARTIEVPTGGGADILVNFGPAELTAGGGNPWQVQLAGSGSVRYSVTSRYSTPNPDAKPRNNGLGLTRSYRQLMKKTITHKEGTYSWTEDAYRLGPTVSTLNPGDEVVVQLTVTAATGLRHVVINDPLPAGLETLDEENSEWLYSGWLYGSEDYGYGYTRREQHDNRVALLIEDLPMGKSSYYYVVRAVTPGFFNAAQALGEEMYLPEINGTSAGARMTVLRR